MEKKEERNLLENVFKKASYSTGFICAKMNKLKNGTVGLLQNAKVSAVDMIESFRGGFESVKGEVGNESEKPSSKIKAGVSDTKKEDESGQAGQRIKELPEELLNTDFEKEIEEIGKEVAKI